MDLDRGMLARLDRQLLARLGRDERFQMVRVPVTLAKWATWKRYCENTGISMGRAIGELINCELASVFGVSGDGAMSRFEQVERRLGEREEELDGRERRLEECEERLRRWSEHLRRSEHEVVIREQRLEAATKMSAIPVQTIARTGRNGPCPCRSGRKYKRCHGAPGRSATGEP